MTLHLVWFYLARGFTFRLMCNPRDEAKMPYKELKYQFSHSLLSAWAEQHFVRYFRLVPRTTTSNRKRDRESDAIRPKYLHWFIQRNDWSVVGWAEQQQQLRHWGGNPTFGVTCCQRGPRIYKEGEIYECRSHWSSQIDRPLWQREGERGLECFWEESLIHNAKQKRKREGRKLAEMVIHGGGWKVCRYG